MYKRQTQHMVNVLCAVFLGPWYGVGVAFCASLIRNLVGAEMCIRDRPKGGSLLRIYIPYECM